MTQTSALTDTCDVRCVHPGAVAEARAHIDGQADSLGAAHALFAALGDPTRLRLLSALQAGPLCTCDLAAVLGVTESAVSHQLRALRTLRLIASDRDGRVVYHRLDDDHVAALLSVAAEHVAEGVAQPSSEMEPAPARSLPDV